MTLAQKVFKKIDEKVMYASNRAVRAWNWTTGKTKADLAKVLADSYVVGLSLGSFLLSPVLGLVLTPVAFHVAHMNHKTNKRIQDLEERAMNEGLLHPFVEVNKELNKKKGYFQAAISIPLYSIGAVNLTMPTTPEMMQDGIGLTIEATGLLSLASNHFVMRANYLPPRKNCFKRGYEKLQTLLQEYKERQPAPGLPSPA